MHDLKVGGDRATCVRNRNKPSTNLKGGRAVVERVRVGQGSTTRSRPVRSAKTRDRHERALACDEKWLAKSDMVYAAYVVPPAQPHRRETRLEVFVVGPSSCSRIASKRVSYTATMIDVDAHDLGRI